MGQVLPAFTYVLGRALDDVAQVSVTYADELATEEDRQAALNNASDDVNFIASVLAYLGAGALVLCYFMYASLEFTAVR